MGSDLFVQGVGHMPALAISYPWECTRTLIQLGHEPLPGKLIRYWQKERFCLPSGWSYIGHLYRREGFIGLYRGFWAKSLQYSAYNLVQKYTYSLCCQWLSIKQQEKPKEMIESIVAEEIALSHQHRQQDGGGCKKENDLHALVYVSRPPPFKYDQEHLDLFLKNWLADCIGNMTGALASFPFFVVYTRLVAQFIGQDECYNGVVSCFLDLFQSRDGLDLIKHTLVPYMIKEFLSSSLWISVRFAASALMEREPSLDEHGYVPEQIEKYQHEEEDLFDDNMTPDMRYSIASKVLFAIISPYLYPLTHTSTRMSVLNTPLAVASNNETGANTWIDCLKYLYRTGQLRNGSNLMSSRRISREIE